MTILLTVVTHTWKTVQGSHVPVRLLHVGLPLLPLSITVILSTVDSPSLNYPAFSRFRTLLLVLSLKLLSPVISRLSYALSTGSRSLNASNTSSSHLPIKFTLPPNLRTFITSSLFNVLLKDVEQRWGYEGKEVKWLLTTTTSTRLHLLLLLLGHQHHPL